MRNEQKDLAEKKSSWIMNNLLEALVCSVLSISPYSLPIGRVKIRYDA